MLVPADSAFVALVRRLHPDTPVRDLERAAGLAQDTIEYYMKASTNLAYIPKAPKCALIARGLQCDPSEVVECFAADLGYPLWGGHHYVSQEDRDLLRSLTGVDRDFLRAYVALNRHMRTTVRNLTQSLLVAARTDRPDS
jgi:hypothetical protein